MITKTKCNKFCELHPSRDTLYIKYSFTFLIQTKFFVTCLLNFEEYFRKLDERKLVSFNVVATGLFGYRSIELKAVSYCVVREENVIEDDVGKIYHRVGVIARYTDVAVQNLDTCKLIANPVFTGFLLSVIPLLDC